MKDDDEGLSHRNEDVLRWYNISLNSSDIDVLYLARLSESTALPQMTLNVNIHIDCNPSHFMTNTASATLYHVNTDKLLISSILS